MVVLIFFSNNPLNIVQFSMTTIYLWISVAAILSHFRVFKYASEEVSIF